MSHDLSSSTSVSETFTSDPAFHIYPVHSGSMWNLKVNDTACKLMDLANLHYAHTVDTEHPGSFAILSAWSAARSVRDKLIIVLSINPGTNSNGLSVEAGLSDIDSWAGGAQNIVSPCLSTMFKKELGHLQALCKDTRLSSVR